MKITLNQTIPIYHKQINYHKPMGTKTEQKVSEYTNNIPLNHSNAIYSNISFGMDPHISFLLNQSKNFKCAYSGMPMISPFEARTIYQKLAKRPNAQSAINFLQQYGKYMHDIESKVFGLFDDSAHKNKRNFQDILIEEAPAALIRLKEKQKLILTSTDSIIDKLSNPIAAQIRTIRDEALLKMEDDTFGRKAPLEAIKKIQATGSELEKVIQIYRTWYKLPSSGRDIDAFIVKYSKKSHEDIAKRLISSAIATVEHIKPASCGGEDNLNNFILVSAQFNNERNTMPLWEYIMLNPQIDIRKNLQAYMDTAINLVHDKNSNFYNKSWYPESIRNSIRKQTAGSVNLNTEALNLTKAQKRDNNFTERLSSKYRVIQK